MSDQAALVIRDRRRLGELRLCKNDLYYLLTEYLGYGWGAQGLAKGFTPELYRPICDWLDAMRRKDQRYIGLALPRFHHKSTIVIGRIIQDYLWDPNAEIIYWTHKDDLADLVVKEAGNHLQKNKKLRTLEPIGIKSDGTPCNILPNQKIKKWVSGSQFTLNRPIWSRFPSLIGTGINSDMTGLHGRRGYVDDPIGPETIADSGLPKVKATFQHSIIPILQGGPVMASFTRWHFQAIYEDWIKDNDWSVHVRSCSENEDGSPDWKLDHPIYGPANEKARIARDLKLQQRQMGRQFAPQMMNVPLSEEDQIWKPGKCEGPLVKASDYKIQTIVILGDPAPRALPSPDRQKARQYQDGERDEWSLSVIGIAQHGQRTLRILLNGIASREWSDDEGLMMAARLMLRYGTPYVGQEEPVARESGFYQNKQRIACAKVGTVGFQWINFKMTRAADAKLHRFRDLASLAENGEFVIAEECDPEFRDGFLDQMRFVPQSRHDDRADSTAYLADPGLAELIPINYPQVVDLLASRRRLPSRCTHIAC